jgi:uncharacterized protein
LNSPISDLTQIIASLDPVLNPGTYAFVSVPNSEILASISAVATIRESEGLSAVIAESDAAALHLPVLLRAAWITLTVNSDLQAVGLTAAFASALGKAGISCNVVAGAWHDHIFVPVDQAALSLSVLKQMQTESARVRQNHSIDESPFLDNSADLG